MCRVVCPLQCRDDSPRVVLDTSPGYFDAVAVINTGNRESIIYQHDASRVNFYPADLIIRNTN